MKTLDVAYNYFKEVDSISVIDSTETLLMEHNRLEAVIKSSDKTILNLRQDLTDMEDRLNDYVETYVTPVDKIKEEQERLSRAFFEIATERNFYQQNIENLKSIISALCAKHSISASFTGQIPGPVDNNGYNSWGNIEGSIGQKEIKPEIN